MTSDVQWRMCYIISPLPFLYFCNGVRLCLSTANGPIVHTPDDAQETIAKKAKLSRYTQWWRLEERRIALTHS
jgi:hypothetical protein